MKTIVVPTNFSAISLNAVNYAADLACVAGANLMLMHVCMIPVAVNEFALPAYYIDDLVTDAEERVEMIKDDLILRTGNRLKVYSKVLEGDVVTVIQQQCQDIDPYAVVMGTEGGSSVERFLWGAKTLSAIQHLSWPVIAVPPGITFSGWNKVGFASDLEDVSHSLPITLLKNIVRDFKAALHVMYVRADDNNSFKEEEKESTGLLYSTLKDLHPQYHYMRHDNVEDRICAFAEKNHLDLLIIVPKNHDLLSRIFRHSHAKRVVLQTPVPVMAVHEK